MYASSDGLLYGSENNSGRIFRFNVTGLTATGLANGPVTSVNDGAHWYVPPALIRVGIGCWVLQREWLANVVEQYLERHFDIDLRVVQAVSYTVLGLRGRDASMKRRAYRLCCLFGAERGDSMAGFAYFSLLKELLGEHHGQERLCVSINRYMLLGTY